VGMICCMLPRGRALQFWEMGANYAAFEPVKFNSPKEEASSSTTSTTSSTSDSDSDSSSSSSSSAGAYRTSELSMAMRGRRPQRPPPRPKDNTPINEAIEYDEMRVMVDNPGAADEMLGVMNKADAIEAARERELDLVLVAGKSDPPVCKIVSYDKYRYMKEKKLKEQKKAASNGQELKELKMSYKIGTHDYDVRRKAAIKFLEQGNKVKFSMLFRGREVVHADVGKGVMLKMAESLEEIGIIDSQPRVLGRQMIMMISPKPVK